MFRIKRVLLMVFLLSGGSAIAHSATKQVDISFKFEEPVTLHEPVALHVRIVNRATYAISIDLGGRDRAFFHCKIITPSGKKVSISFEHQSLAELWGAIHLAPNDTYSKRILLSELYRFDAPGTYHVTVTAKVPVATGKVSLPYKWDKNQYSQVVIENAKLRLLMLPRNETALRKKCEALYSHLQEAHEEYDIQRIAEELSYVRDPLAIPYITKLIEKREEWLAVQGLKNIDTDASWEAMILVVNGKCGKVTVDYAKSLLRQKLPKIRDPGIRRKIADAIR
jgi:hypothetical protein